MIRLTILPVCVHKHALCICSGDRWKDVHVGKMQQYHGYTAHLYGPIHRFSRTLKHREVDQSW